MGENRSAHDHRDWPLVQQRLGPRLSLGLDVRKRIQRLGDLATAKLPTFLGESAENSGRGGFRRGRRAGLVGTSVAQALLTAAPAVLMVRLTSDWVTRELVDASQAFSVHLISQ